MGKRYAVSFNAKIIPVKPINDEFTLCKCRVMHTGKNRNFSYISRDAAEKAQPTLFNIPVIGHLYEDEDGELRMGGHDAELGVDNNGDYVFKSLCVPYGVVPESANVGYEDILEPNGDVQTYLTCDVILWTGRYPELFDAIYSERTYFGQSMEINVFDTRPLKEDKNYTELTDYSYSALCLLGKSDDPDENVEPCFPLSDVSPYQFSIDDEFYKNMDAMKEELKKVFEMNNARREEGIMDESCTATVAAEEPVVEQCADAVCNTVAEQGAEPTAEVSAEMEKGACQTDDACAASDGEQAEDGEFDNKQDAGEAAAEPSFKFTYGERCEALASALPFSENVFYWLCDFDDKYAFVQRTVVDENGMYDDKYGRFEYTYDEIEKVAAIVSEFEEMYPKWLTKEELDVLEAMRIEYAELVKYKEGREEADRKAAYDAIIDEFSDVSASEEFAHILEEKYSYKSSDELRKDCYAVRGMLATPAVRHKPVSEPVIPVMLTKDINTKSNQEVFFSEYGK